MLLYSVIQLPCCFLVRRELGDMLDHPLDNLGVAFPEGCHEAGDLPVVLRVNVGPGGVEELDDLQVASVSGQPQAGIAFLVPHINLENVKRHIEVRSNES